MAETVAVQAIHKRPAVSATLRKFWADAHKPLSLKRPLTEEQSKVRFERAIKALERKIGPEKTKQLLERLRQNEMNRLEQKQKLVSEGAGKNALKACDKEHDRAVKYIIEDYIPGGWKEFKVVSFTVILPWLTAILLQGTNLGGVLFWSGAAVASGVAAGGAAAGIKRLATTSRRKHAKNIAEYLKEKKSGSE